MKAPSNAEPSHQLVKAKSRTDDADRTENRGLLAVDLVTGERQPVAARCRDVFGKSDDGYSLLVSQLPDAPVEQCRLNRRAAGRVNDDGDRDEPRGPKRSFDCRGVARQRNPAASQSRHDDPFETQNRNDRAALPQTFDIETIANFHAIPNGVSRRSWPPTSEFEPTALAQYRLRRGGEPTIGFV